MDDFAYLSVLLSIIIGLALGQVLTAFGRLIQHRAVVAFHWVPLLWAVLVMMICTQAWWSMWGLHYYEDWTFAAFLVVLMQTILVYMMSAVVMPESVDAGGVDLWQHFMRNRRWFFGFMLATILVSLCKDLVLYGRLPVPLNVGFHVFLAGACVTAMWLERPRAHEVLVVVCGSTMVGYIAILFMRLH